MQRHLLAATITLGLAQILPGCGHMPPKPPMGPCQGVLAEDELKCLQAAAQIAEATTPGIVAAVQNSGNDVDCARAAFYNIHLKKLGQQVLDANPSLVKRRVDAPKQ
jgi:hypothetical protein